MALVFYLSDAAETYRQLFRSFLASDNTQKEWTMRNIAKTAIALTIAATAVVAAASPSLAQTNGSRYQYQQNQNSVPYDVQRDRGENNG